MVSRAAALLGLSTGTRKSDASSSSDRCSRSSSLLAIERCEAFGLKVRRVLAIIDRLEGGSEAFAQRGYELTSLLTIRDLGIEPAG